MVGGRWCEGKRVVGGVVGGGQCEVDSVKWEEGWCEERETV